MNTRTLIRTVCALLLTSSLLGCGKELARTRFDNPDMQTLHAQLAADEVAFWVSLDVEYEGELELGFDIKLLQDGKEVAHTRCNALDVSTKMMSMETTFGSKHTKRYDGKMNCSARVPKAGATDIQASVLLNGLPQTMKKLELFVKQ